MTVDEGDDEDDMSRRLSDDEEGSDEPGMSAKRAKDPNGRPRRVKSEVPPVSIPATKVFERDTDGSVELDYWLPPTFVRLPRYSRTVQAISLYLLIITFDRY